jgi:hypothetical protein
MSIAQGWCERICEYADERFSGWRRTSTGRLYRGGRSLMAGYFHVMLYQIRYTGRHEKDSGVPDGARGILASGAAVAARCAAWPGQGASAEWDAGVGGVRLVV